MWNKFVTFNKLKNELQIKLHMLLFSRRKPSCKMAVWKMNRRKEIFVAKCHTNTFDELNLTRDSALHEEWQATAAAWGECEFVLLSAEQRVWNHRCGRIQLRLSDKLRGGLRLRLRAEQRLAIAGRYEGDGDGDRVAKCLLRCGRGGRQQVLVCKREGPRRHASGGWARGAVGRAPALEHALTNALQVLAAVLLLRRLAVRTRQATLEADKYDHRREKGGEDRKKEH